MANPDVSRVPWLRDEVILALDVVARYPQKKYPKDSHECQTLSEELNSLPIIPHKVRGNKFRNTIGMSIQLEKLYSLQFMGRICGHTSGLFAVVIQDFLDLDELSIVAAAIRRNTEFSQKIDPSYFRRTCSFKEGHLLEGIHRFLEEKAKIEKDDHCEICGMFPDALYSRNISSDAILEIHCLVAPQLLNERTSLNKKNAITVCPMCHKVLHALRPWITENTLSSVIQWK